VEEAIKTGVASASDNVREACFGLAAVLALCDKEELARIGADVFRTAPPDMRPIRWGRGGRLILQSGGRIGDGYRAAALSVAWDGSREERIEAVQMLADWAEACGMMEEDLIFAASQIVPALGNEARRVLADSLGKLVSLGGVFGPRVLALLQELQVWMPDMSA
jgi:hypothetical protein